MRNISHNHTHRALDRTSGAVGVNRTLDLSRVAAVGLDLDHTLALYRDSVVNAKALAETSLNLVRFKSYSRAVTDIRYASANVARGLVLDAQTGHVLKLDGHNRVITAFRDGRWQRRDAVRSQYGQGEVDMMAPRFTTIDSMFDLPCVCLFGQYAPPRRESAASLDYGVFHTDVREMLDRTHVTGSLKGWIIENIASVVLPASALLEPLLRFRTAGKKVFLLTNSDFGYASALLDYVFERPGPTAVWREVFDAVVVNANKPEFFSSGARLTAIAASDRARVFSGGAAALEKYLGVSGAQTLYIGDNPAADCTAARQSGWRTGLVAPELTHDSNPLPGSATNKRDARRSGWGDALWENGEPTRFGRFIREVPDIFAAEAETLLSVLPDHVFTSGEDDLRNARL